MGMTRKCLCVMSMFFVAIVHGFGATALGSENPSRVILTSSSMSDQSQQDERIKFTVEDRLRTDGRIDWEVLEVEVDQGQVTLYGEVETKDQKGHATLIVSTVPGVQEVKNRIIVDKALSPDHRLQKAVWNALRGVDALRQQTDRLRVHAKDGVVTLSGMVETDIQKAAAEKAAESVSDVTNVIDTIHVGTLPYMSQEDTLRKEGRDLMP